MKRFVAVLMLAGGLLVGGAAFAGTYTMTFTQTGSDVVATGSGTLTGLSGPIFSNASQPNQLIPQSGVAIFGVGNVDVYAGVTGPSSFGTGGYYGGGTSTGDNVGILGGSGRIVVPAGYTGTSSLTNSITYVGQSLSSLGLTPGTYTYNVPGSNTLVLTINEAPASIPSLSEWTQLLLALMTITLVGWHFHRERSY